jgi:RecB family exonuclease
MKENTAPVTSRRRTLIAANLHAAKRLRLQLAQAGEHGAQVMLIEQLAGRLAGGFEQLADEASLQQALRDSLDTIALGELAGIRDLPGTPRALLATLRKCWSAAVDLDAEASRHARIDALAAVERAVRARLPISVQVPPELARKAIDRLAIAPQLLGEVDAIGIADLELCWQPMLLALAGVTRVRWLAGCNAVPAWLEGSMVQVEQEPPRQPQRRVVSAAHAAHEALEAMRWVRRLLASGAATVDQIAIASAHPAMYDQTLQSLSQTTELELHFVHGRPVVTTPEGQVAAALADTLLNGPTRRRLRRCALASLPPGWENALPSKIILRSAASWQKALSRMTPESWPDGQDGTAQLRGVVALLLAGADGAEVAGERLLSGRALLIWRRALLAGPPQALLGTIAALRQDDGRDSCASVCWMPAQTLAAAPRRYVWLLGLNSGAWPRHSVEDGLLPGHIMNPRLLEPRPLGLADRQAFDAIARSCEELVLSFARRDTAGRRAASSALLRGLGAAEHLDAHAPAVHAAGESDRLLGRPLEFGASAQAVSAMKAWRNWHSAYLTEHDGLVRKGHPALAALVGRVHSASSLKSMLRNPIAHLWEYGMRWKEPDTEEQLLELEPMQFGKLVHAIAENALARLEAVGSLSRASAAQLQEALQSALTEAAARWVQEEAVPPAVVWQATLVTVAASARAALECGRGTLAGARSFAEVPFGGSVNGGQHSPWNNDQPLEIPGTGLFIKGVIDRLDLSPDGKVAIVRDYKTGNRMIKAGAALDGGAELQRCLYAFAVRALLADVEEVRSSLFYTRHVREFGLDAPDQAFEALREALVAASGSFSAGHALPGPDAGDTYDKFVFLLPANVEYRRRKEQSVRTQLADAAKIWEME